jgi:peptidoglycan/LPS O-acetylase OafA/YrhL
VLPALLVVLLHLLLGGGAGMRLFDRARAIATHGQTLLPHYWFVWAILFEYLLFWLCRKLLPEKAANWAILAGTVLFTAGTALAGFDRCWWVCALAFPTGAFFAEYEESIFAWCGRKKSNYWLALLACGAAFAALYLTGKPACWTLCYIFISLIAALVIARLPLDRWRLPVLGWIGVISYELYLVHIPVMEFLQKNGMPDRSQILFVAVALAASVLAAFVIRLLCQLITHR